MELPWLKYTQSADEYLRHSYKIPQNLPKLPLPDEPFVSKWQTAKGRGALDFLADGLGLSVFKFTWREMESVEISFANTLGGALPLIDTSCHEDFCAMEAAVNGRAQLRELPLTVNAFTIEARALPIFRHRLILLNRAPYSNISAEKMGLSIEDWLERSHRLRLRHECAHYETLRLLGDMENHALDEIIADGLGQIAAFGNFDAERQRLFFGIKKGQDICDGRLSFYCQKVSPNQRQKIYRAIDKALETVSEELNELISNGRGEAEILTTLAGRSIAEIMRCQYMT